MIAAGAVVQINSPAESGSGGSDAGAGGAAGAAGHPPGHPAGGATAAAAGCPAQVRHVYNCTAVTALLQTLHESDRPAEPARDEGAAGAPVSRAEQGAEQRAGGHPGDCLLRRIHSLR